MRRISKKYTFLPGVAKTEYILILIVIATVAIIVFQALGQRLQQTVASLAAEVSHFEVVGVDCVPVSRMPNPPSTATDLSGNVYRYDERVQRYRNLRTGRFVRVDRLVVCD